jgi:hypothetical protein
MARRRSRALIPEARQGLEQLKLQVMKEQGYVSNAAGPEQVKYEVAERLGVPLQRGYNGQITTEQAGKIGGNIGGPMVRELIRRAQESLAAGRRF